MSGLQPNTGASAPSTPTPQAPAGPPQRVRGEDSPLQIEGRFPRLQQFVKDQNISLTRGPGEGYAEIFPLGEGGSPDPTRRVVQVRPLTREKGFDPNSVASADALHFFGGVDRESGKPLDPEFYGLKQDFIKNMSPREKQFADKKFNEAKAEKRTGTNFESKESFMQNVWGDALIRGAIFPELMSDPQDREDHKNQVHLTDKQRGIVKRMQQSLSRQ